MRSTKTKRILITGGAGFLGSYLIRLLLEKGEKDIVVFDRLSNHSPVNYSRFVRWAKGNVLDADSVKRLFETEGPFDVVYHLAAAMPNKALSDEMTWKTNVEGTAHIAKEAVGSGVKSFVFTSSNVTYGIPSELPVTEETPPRPLEAYGKSKLAAESELAKYKTKMNIQIFRCPVITGVGRLGLQSILYEFISENKNVYLLGDGSNIYQFVDASDVCDALIRASRQKGFDIYVIGGDGYMPLRKLYEGVIEFAGSSSAIVPLPQGPAVWALAVLDRLNISPVGVYQYTMMSRSIYADTTKLKTKLKWRPRKTNLESFIENYRWYLHRKKTFKVMGKSNLSANRSLPKMGAFKLLKALS